jgi:hypothetical protein
MNHSKIIIKVNSEHEIFNSKKRNYFVLKLKNKLYENRRNCQNVNYRS